MKITVINGTEVRGVTYELKELFLEPFRGSAEITEFYLPKDGPGFCAGCKVCFLTDEERCKDREVVKKLEVAMLGADLLVFTSPAYVFHATGAVKVMLDHFGYRWMPHRPAGEMFGKRAVIISQCLGSGAKSAATDIKHSLLWWGISSVRICTFRLMSEVKWDRIPEKKRAAMAKKLKKTAGKLMEEGFAAPARTGLPVKMRFHMVRLLQKKLGKDDPDYTDYKYWKERGWTGKERPWKRRRPAAD
ncbi:MAG: NAD(P)H-dependent oxidoreductase [Clostridia bacterium]|nr:NAD(P)H-dependent oxidoreductase [Clostridia bacterium]